MEVKRQDELCGVILRHETVTAGVELAQVSVIVQTAGPRHFDLHGWPVMFTFDTVKNALNCRVHHVIFKKAYNMSSYPIPLPIKNL